MTMGRIGPSQPMFDLDETSSRFSEILEFMAELPYQENAEDQPPAIAEKT